MSKPTPGAGGAYRYDPETDRYVLLEATADDLAPAHPLAAPEPPPVAPAKGKPATVTQPLEDTV